jgi:hypothetical protein
VREEAVLLGVDPNSIPVSEITRLYIAKEYGAEDARRVRTIISLEALPETWKEYFEEKLKRFGI